MSNITYRKSIKKDIPSINNLFIEMNKTINSRLIREGENPVIELENGYDEGYLDRFYVNDDRFIFVALDNNKVIGYLSIVNKKELGNIYLDDYCVYEDYRGQGIGSRLIQMSFDFAKEQGYDQVVAHVQGANKESVGFYFNKGFKLVEIQDNVSENRYLIKRVENHLSREVSEELTNRNSKIINKVLEKIKCEYPDSIDLVAVAGSFASGLYHEKSDLDLLIVANEDVDGLCKCFILDGIGYDIYYHKWDSLEEMSKYNNMFVTKLKDINIVYYRNEDILKKYNELQDILNINMNDDEKNKEKIESLINKMIIHKNSIQSSTSLNDCYKLVGLMMNDIENIIYINNKDYSYGGTKNILSEINYMGNKPKGFIDEYKKILDLTNIEDIKNWSRSIVGLVLSYFNKEDNSLCEEKDNSIDKRDITKNDLIGTYEELYSNYYNKLVNAAKTNNKYLSFRTMIDAQGFFDEFTDAFNLREFNLLDKYNPNDLMANLNEFTVLLNKWKELYDQFQLDVEEYDSIDELYSIDSNNRMI